MDARFDETLSARGEPQFPSVESLLVMAAWAVIFGWLSIRMFRWE